MEDLIENGADILNPIQPLPGLMDPEILGERFGDRLIFHGGLDVQSLLINGTPGEIREHVQHYLEVLGPERHILAPANTVLPATPAENLLAAYETALCFQ
jgi:uroporphyrinogen decarboxylase